MNMRRARKMKTARMMMETRTRMRTMKIREMMMRTTRR
jgi:hypothetical protein